MLNYCFCTLFPLRYFIVILGVLFGSHVTIFTNYDFFFFTVYGCAVDAMERASTPDFPSNWDWNQLFLNISVILKVLIRKTVLNLGMDWNISNRLDVH